MQRLDAAIHHLGKAGQLRDVAHRQARLGERLGGAAGRDQLDGVAAKRAREIDQSGFVRDGEKCPSHAA